MKFLKKDKRGLTLLELMISMSLIVLLSVGIVGFYNLNQKGSKVCAGYRKLNQKADLITFALSKELRRVDPGLARIEDGGKRLLVAKGDKEVPKKEGGTKTVPTYALFEFREDTETEHVLDDYALYYDADYYLDPEVIDKNPPKCLARGIKKFQDKSFFAWRVSGSGLEDPKLAEEWVDLPNLPHHKFLAGAVYYKGSIFLYGGMCQCCSCAIQSTYGNPHRELLRYDIKEKVWSRTALNGEDLALPPVGLKASAVILYNNEMYVFGGENNTTLWYNWSWNQPGGIETRRVLKYNPETNTWVDDQNHDGYLKPLPVATSYAAIASLNGKIYIIGGHGGHENDETGKRLLQEYDVSNNTWRVDTLHGGELAPPPRDVFGAKAFVLYNRIYVVGGGQHKQMLQIYDPKTNTWEYKDGNDSPGLPAVGFYSGGVIGNKMYLIGGWRPDEPVCVSRWVTIGEVCFEDGVYKEKWTSTEDASLQKRKYPTSAVDDKGTIYMIGSYNNPRSWWSEYYTASNTMEARNFGKFKKSVAIRCRLIENMKGLDRHLKAGHKGKSKSPTPMPELLLSTQVAPRVAF
jgi:prepilin-type N-terminal cleavage/methylation domain-containing protein